MYIDTQNRFSNAQTTTTGTGSASTPGVLSTNQIDLTAATDYVGTGENLYIVVQITTALTSSGSNDAMDVSLYTDGDVAFGSPTFVQRLGTFPAVAAIGTTIIARIAPERAMERYIGLYYLSQTTDAFTAGAVTAFITHDIDAYRAYAVTSTIS